MKLSYCLYGAVVGILMVGVVPVYAEETAPGETPVTPAPARSADHQGVRKNLQNRIINLATNVANRERAVVDRLTNISGRIGTRIQKLQKQNVDTKAAEEKLKEADTKLVELKNALSAITVSVNQAVGSDKPRESFESVRAQFATIREDIKNTHKLLTETVTLLKDAVRASTTNGVAGAVRENEKRTATSSTSSVE